MLASLRLRPARLMALLVLVAAAVFSTVAPGTRAAETDNVQVNQAVTWLSSQQIANGGFAAFGDESNAGATADVVYALVAAGVDPQTITSDAGNSPLDYLEAASAAASTDPGLAGKIVLALTASGHDPSNVDGLDLLAAIQGGLDPDSGLYGFGAVNHSYALLALASAGMDIDPTAVEALLDIQVEDGSWAFTGDTAPGAGDTNTTAVAVQALVAVGGDESAVEAGIAYILSVQDESGAIAYDLGEAPDIVGDANSTSVAIQALLSAGEDASDQIAALGTFQNDSGAFFWRADFAGDSLLATAQAIPALLGAPLPIQPLLEEAAPGDAGEARQSALAPANPKAGCVYHEITEHNVCGSFAEFWVVNGGLMIFGYPLSEEFVDENGRTVQYFERARFELHPELAGTPYHVLLGRTGAELIEHASHP